MQWTFSKNPLIYGWTRTHDMLQLICTQSIIIFQLGLFHGRQRSSKTPGVYWAFLRLPRNRLWLNYLSLYNKHIAGFVSLGQLPIVHQYIVFRILSCRKWIKRAVIEPSLLEPIHIKSKYKHFESSNDPYQLHCCINIGLHLEFVKYKNLNLTTAFLFIYWSC